jgi:hypothetical protein
MRFEIAPERPVYFPLILRIPAWADGATLLVDGQATPARPGTFVTVEREWQSDARVELIVPMAPRMTRRYNDAATLERGPLVYALPIGERWVRVNADLPYRDLPHADWEVYPTTPWNYALDLSEGTLEEDVQFAENPMGGCPFSPEGAPVSATVRGRRVPEWQMKRGSAADAPPSPVVSDEPLETLTLKPYGCSNLRITEFPVLHRD